MRGSLSHNFPPQQAVSEQYTWADLECSLKFLEAEGFIERWYDENGQECVRIAPGAETATL